MFLPSNLKPNVANTLSIWNIDQRTGLSATCPRLLSAAGPLRKLLGLLRKLQNHVLYIYDVTMHGWIVAMLCNVMHCNVVCIYVSMYACMCACIYGSVCMYVCMMDVSMHKCMDACMHVWIMNVCIVCIDGRMEEWMDACMRGMIVLTDSFPLLKDWFQDFCW